MEASRAVVERAGGAYAASLNHYLASKFGWVATVQVDEFVFMVGPDHFAVSRFAIDDWVAGLTDTAAVIELDTADQAWELLQHVRRDCPVWQCGACDAWVYTSNRPRIGVLQCATCGEGGVDFRHADRHVGDES